jgi:V/A-type H+-transporting ATPase subunit I
MFGDLGQGLCVALLGIVLFKLKGMQLGEIMSRIGVASMAFGSAYGSVFGIEHALDWFYVGVLGLHEKPVEVMRPDTTNIILLAAIGLGVIIIFMVIIFNMAIGIKHRDFDRTVLSHNGLAGLVLYGSIFLMIFDYVTHVNYLSRSAELFLIIIPLIVVFFREPLTHLIKYKSKADILKDKPLAAVKDFQEGSINIQELFMSQYVSARFGRMPTDSYSKLHFYKDEPFMLYPVKSSVDYIWCLYAMADINKDEIDAIFHDLQFERVFIPDEYLKSNESAEGYIKRCVAAGGIPEDENAEDKTKYGQLEAVRPKTVLETMFPHGIGNFLTETFFELFEVCLSFVSNTMSFLRVGGFILVHAGMMAVVFTLAEMVGGGALPLVIIIGNAFVMVLEGLIVGIQVLRLEFYEIFSRFFDATGEPFKPVTVNEIK